MIEIIYKGEDGTKNDELSIKLPKNVRQIGDCDHNNIKIYVEDFVMTYVKHFASRNLKYGVLLGNIKRGNGNVYLFVTGVVCARPLLDNEIIFDEDVWTGLYEDIKTYFEDVEIVGWFAALPGLLENDMPQITKLHLDNFAGNDKVCFLIDRVECEDSFYVYDEGGMKCTDGHYIYYEKNADMQSYMALHMETTDVPEDYDQIKKRGINATVHKIFFESGEKKEKIHNNEYGLSEYIGIKKESKKEDINDVKPGILKRRFPAFAYSASSFMLIAILLGTIAIMNASGQIKDLKSVVAGIGSSKETKAYDSDTPKIIDAVGNVETTKGEETTKTTEEDSDTTTNVNQTTTQKPSETKNSEDETTKTPEPTVAPVIKEPQYYIVKNGDSLYSISLKMYGNISMIDSIKKANSITNENYIKEGETILLP